MTRDEYNELHQLVSQLQCSPDPDYYTPDDVVAYRAGIMECVIRLQGYLNSVHIKTEV